VPRRLLISFDFADLDANLCGPSCGRWNDFVSRWGLDWAVEGNGPGKSRRRPVASETRFEKSAFFGNERPKLHPEMVL
jgi:hypothetical protein